MSWHDSHHDAKQFAYTPEERKVAQGTVRAWRKPTAITRHFISLDLPRTTSVLDFGTGKFGYQIDHLRDAGYDVDGYDFEYGDSVPFGSKTYDIVLASNVINTLTSESAFRGTISDLKSFTDSRTKVILNYPQPPRSPRNLGWSNAEMRQHLESEGFVIDSTDKYSTGDIDTKAAVIWTGHF